MTSLTRFIVLGALSLLAGCARHQDPLPVIGTVPEFDLIDEQDNPISNADLRGRIWIADFIFTQCAGPCPRMSKRMGELQNFVASAPNVTLVSFSVDPTRDTPAVLTAYGKHYGARPGRWRFVTGDETAIRDLAIKGFKLTVEPATDATPILHSTYFMLVDPAGRIRGAFDGDDPAAFDRLKDAIQRLLTEKD
jgi:protein SCO1/2